MLEAVVVSLVVLVAVLAATVVVLVKTLVDQNGKLWNLAIARTPGEFRSLEKPPAVKSVSNPSTPSVPSSSFLDDPEVREVLASVSEIPIGLDGT